jgi:hypothetical protein
LHNPVYVQADLDIYEFFKSQGANIVNDAADFSGTNGCYLYKGRDVDVRKSVSLKDHILVVAPHEGFVPSDIWLACRKKMLCNRSFAGTPTHKAKNTWLAGKIKCGRCGFSLATVFSGDRGNRKGYFRCRKRTDRTGCEGCGTLRILEVEQFIYDEMLKKMQNFRTLSGGACEKANPKLTALRVEYAQVEGEIEKLLDTLTEANATLLSYANNKIEELDAKRQALMKAIADMSAQSLSPERLNLITSHLDNWDSTNFDDRRLVLDGLVTRIRATSENIQIEWKI